MGWTSADLAMAAMWCCLLGGIIAPDREPGAVGRGGRLMDRALNMPPMSPSCGSSLDSLLLYMDFFRSLRALLFRSDPTISSVRDDPLLLPLEQLELPVLRTEPWP